MTSENWGLKSIEIENLPGPLRCLFKNKADINEAQAMLRQVQGALRADPEGNAFLAIAFCMHIKEVDTVTQSIEYTRCSDGTTFVVPFLGHNFGVGEEAGSIPERLSNTHGERFEFDH